MVVFVLQCDMLIELSGAVQFASKKFVDCTISTVQLVILFLLAKLLGLIVIVKNVTFSLPT